MLRTGCLARYKKSNDSILKKGAVYHVKIARKKVGDEIWPTLYAYEPRSRIEGAFWLKMVQYASENEMERSWEAVEDGDDASGPGVLLGDRTVPIVGGHGNMAGGGSGDLGTAVGPAREAEKEQTLKGLVKSHIDTPTLYLALAEECSELAQACLKEWRALTGANPTPVDVKTAHKHVVEEYTDVSLCADMLDLEPDSDIRSRKLARWGERIGASMKPRDIPNP